MKLKINEPTGMTLEVHKPDQQLKAYWIGKVREKWEQELREFMEEVSVGLRKLEPGQSVTLSSRPIVVTLERTADSAGASHGD